DFIIEFVESGNKLFFNTLNKIYYLDLPGLISENSFKQLEIINLPDNEVINKLLITNSGVILISYSSENTGSNIYFARLEGNKLFIDSKVTLKDNITASCLNNSAGIFYSTNTGLFNFDFETQKSFLLFNKKFNDKIDIILKDNVGNLWAGSRLGGLIQYSLIQNRIIEYNYNPETKNSILSDVIFSLYEDFSGNIWIGHGGDGISIINLNQKQFYSYSYNPFDLNTISSNTVLCFNETDKEILIGTKFSGLEIWHKENNWFEHIRFDSIFNINIREYAVWYICKEDYNLFWLATNFGLIRATKQNDRWHFKRYFENVDFIAIRYIYIDPKSNMWVGSYNGLYLIPYDKRDKMLFYHYTHTGEAGSLSDRVITSILIDDFNNLWVGTENGGLNLLEKEFYSYNFISDNKPELKFKHFTAVGQKKGYLNDNEINCLINFTTDQIWIGTQGGGINILNPENFAFSQIKEGLPGTNVFGILKDPSGNYWISTNSGICRYS
ncbi:MAG: two-component regulator propeller domain-containing protein, partial [Candidatus Paceibacterota bacterium]